MSIGFIGLGNMAGAIIAGMRASKHFCVETLIGCDHNQSKRDLFSEKYAVKILQSDEDVAASADILVLAVKPKALDELLPRISSVMKNGQLVLALAAGKKLDFYRLKLGNFIPVIRALPNINVKANAGVTALCANKEVTDEGLKLAEKLFLSVGTVTHVKEEQFSAFSAITGAAPAFVYLFIDALASAGLKAGISKAMALQAACEMIIGSAKLVLQTKEHPLVLIDQVTSPGGSTIQGMHALAAHGFEYAVHQAVAAVIQQDQQMSQ